MYPIFEGFHQDSHPMAMLSSIINSLCTYHSEYATNNRKVDLEHFDAACEGGKVSLEQFQTGLGLLREQLKGMEGAAKEYTSYNKMCEDRYKNIRMTRNLEQKYKVPLTFNQSIGFQLDDP